MIDIEEHFPILVVTFAGSLTGLSYGYQAGQIGQILTMDGFEILFGMINEDGSFGVNKSITPAITIVTFLIGCLFGAMAVSFLADKFGRKYCIILSGALICPLGCVLQIFSNSLNN